MSANWKAFDPSLYLVIGQKDLGARDLLTFVQACVKGGVSLVQLREKEATDSEIYPQAQALHDALKRLGVPLIINDRVDLAKNLGAEGVHLGQEDLPVAKARAILGEEAIIGFSAGSKEEMDPEALGLADYLALGPVFATTTKPDAGPPLGLREFLRLKALSPKPVVAIGGIGRENVAELAASGLVGVAVVSALARAPEPYRAAKELQEIITQARKGLAS